MTAAICIHGHFYQPARENPWTDEIEPQPAAAPYHDWNERITAECYAPNTAARVQQDRRVVATINNYTQISFDVGPTLLRWLARYAPPVYAKIIDADRISAQAWGWGNALACAYNHLIMPLASRLDKVTQVRWAGRDFARRFGRPPEGMWLPETAVDLETLDVLAQQGIRFTILAPHQVGRTRTAPGEPWAPATEETLEVFTPYQCALPGGRSIAVFVYDKPISRAIAFEGVLHDSAVLVEKLLSRLGAGTSTGGADSALLVAATDGETYGHHHRFGEMALAAALRQFASLGQAGLTNLAAALAAHPLRRDVEIKEQTAWSCPHGIERWRSDCGCNSGQGLHQRWRAPLRDAITWLKGELDHVFDQEGRRVFGDPWAARDDAIELIDGTPEAADGFLTRYLRAPQHRPEALRLLEMQRQGMLMQSSDGWFFDDVAGLETVQILTHAARTVELASAFGAKLQPPLISRLRRAEGNTPAYPDGAAVYERLVLPRARAARSHEAIR